METKQKELEDALLRIRLLKEENDKLKGKEPEAILSNPGINRNRKTKGQSKVLTHIEIKQKVTAKLV